MKFLRLYTNLFQQRFRFRAIPARALDGLRPAIGEHHSSAGLKLIALGMAAKIIVIIEYQNFRATPNLLPETISRGQPADSSTHDHQIVALAGRSSVAQRTRRFPIAHPMSKSELAIVVATNPGSSRGVIIRSFFRREL